MAYVFLGASTGQLSGILAAKEKGYEVVTIDNRPDNKGHQFSDYAYYADATDFEAVRDVLVKNVTAKIEGVIAYASDPCASVAAELRVFFGLSGQAELEATKMLTHKGKLRGIQSRLKLPCPKNVVLEKPDPGGLARVAKLLDCREAILKPVDSSGSKGVAKIELSGAQQRWDVAVRHAMDWSRSKTLIVEELVQRNGPQIAGDIFMVAGRCVQACFADEHFNASQNGLTPIGQSFPTSHSISPQIELVKQIELICNEVGYLNGPMNIDAIVTLGGEVMILDLGPRSGGCLIPDAIRTLSDFDPIEEALSVAAGNQPSSGELKPASSKNFFATYVIHSASDGILSGFNINPKGIKKIASIRLEKNIGDQVKVFNGSNTTIGYAVLEFENIIDMEDFFSDPLDRFGVSVA